MKSVYDVQQLLKRYGILIYTGNRKNDLKWMEWELKELWNAKVITLEEFQLALKIIKLSS